MPCTRTAMHMHVLWNVCIWGPIWDDPDLDDLVLLNSFSLIQLYGFVLIHVQIQVGLDIDNFSVS